MQRISLVGVSGCGKSTVASKLLHLMPNCSYVELDAMHHGPNWTPQPSFAQDVEARVTNEQHWIADGHYRKVRNIVWQHATTIVFLDYSLVIVFPRLLWRTLKRIILQLELWNGNRESWYSQFCTSESLLLFALRCHTKKINQIEDALVECDKQQIVRLCSPAETEAWLEQVQKMRK